MKTSPLAELIQRIVRDPTLLRPQEVRLPDIKFADLFVKPPRTATPRPLFYSNAEPRFRK